MALLDVSGLDAFYGQFQALFGIDFSVGEGETVALIGANGAGKSTLLRALTGMVPAPAGAIRFQDREIGGLPPHAIARAGIAMVPEGRQLFSSLSVEENLRMGEAAGRGGAWNLAEVYALFPALGERRNAPATLLSGGQQQMVAIGRALMANPALLLCDEISLGLAPIIVQDIYRAMPAIKRSGAALVVVEQNVQQALQESDRAYCLQEGRVSLTGRAEGLSREAIARAYFGEAEPA